MPDEWWSSPPPRHSHPLPETRWSSLDRSLSNALWSFNPIINQQLCLQFFCILSFLSFQFFFFKFLFLLKHFYEREANFAQHLTRIELKDAAMLIHRIYPTYSSYDEPRGSIWKGVAKLNDLVSYLFFLHSDGPYCFLLGLARRFLLVCGATWLAVMHSSG